MYEQIKREEGVHGKHWNTVHEGYFSDPAVAAPLVKKIQEIADKTKANRIIDLGGGTGFLLSKIFEAGVAPGVSLVNLDSSFAQLDAASKTGFSCISGSVDSFSRCDLGAGEEGHLFIMRSVLHYFGKNGLRPALRHLRAQARPGEFFVHQTASFCYQQEADCLNELYQLMHTQKWYPGVDFLGKCLRAEGWQVLEVLPALPLRLKSEDLKQRYHLKQTDIRRISERLAQNFEGSEEFLQKTASGFSAFLPYWIYVCTAVPVAV